jgi:hypothetical protein
METGEAAGVPGWIGLGRVGSEEGEGPSTNGAHLVPLDFGESDELDFFFFSVPPTVGVFFLLLLLRLGGSARGPAPFWRRLHGTPSRHIRPAVPAPHRHPLRTPYTASPRRIARGQYANNNNKYVMQIIISTSFVNAYFAGRYRAGCSRHSRTRER